MDVATLAAVASNTLVTAAVTDAWKDVRNKIARLFGRGEPDHGTERRLEATYSRLQAAPPAELKVVQANLAAQWTTRLTDLLEEHPDAQSELLGLVKEIQERVRVTTASDHSITSGGDIHISADRGGSAIGIAHSEGASAVVHPARQGPMTGAGRSDQILMAGHDFSAWAQNGGLAAGTIETVNFVPPPRMQQVGRPVSLSPRPVILAGREKLLTALHARLCQGNEGPRIVALHGMGGVGKTSLAVEYAHRQQATAGIVWQFPAEDPVTLTAEFARLATLLGAAGGPLDPRDPIASVHAVLADSPLPWLLVFDNVRDSAFVQSFLPPAGNGQVLITSQSALWPSEQGAEVPVLDLGDSVGFLIARSGDPDGQSAAVLAGELGGLPLALEQAAAYIQATGSTLAAYSSLFRQRRNEMLSRGQPSGYRKTVATTWAMAFTRLEEEVPIAAGLLRLLACFAPEPIPLGLLLKSQASVTIADTQTRRIMEFLAGNLLSQADAIAALRRYSLINPAGPGLVMVHRLVQATTLAQVSSGEEAAWRKAAVALTEKAIPDEEELPANWPIYASLMPHAQAVLPHGSAALARVADYLGWIGSFPAALSLWRVICDARKNELGPDDPATLNARAHVAFWSGQAGETSAARDMLAELLPIREQLRGSEDSSTLATRSNLAALIGQAGDAAAARDMLAGLLPVQERILGPEHRDTLATRHILARWTGEAGDAATARDMLAELMPIEEAVLGTERPFTLATRHALASWTGQAGDAATARDMLAELLPIRERILGREHPATLGTWHALGRWTGQAGDAAAARDMLAELLPIRERILGREHPATQSTWRTLARWIARLESQPGP